jgi:hypothetical protein
MGFMNAALGVRFLPDDFLRLLFRPPFFAEPFLADLREDDLREDFRDDFFFPPFFFAILFSWFGDRMRFVTVCNAVRQRSKV